MLPRSPPPFLQGRETCKQVASLFGLTVEQLQALNPGLKCSTGGYFRRPGQAQARDQRKALRMIPISKP